MFTCVNEDVNHVIYWRTVFDYCAHNISDMNDQQCQNVPLICLQRAAIVRITEYAGAGNASFRTGSIYEACDILTTNRAVCK